MQRFVTLSLLAFAAAAPAHAHFVFIAPEPGDAKAKIVFSDNLEPDEGVPIDKIEGLKLRSLGGDGKTPVAVAKKLGEHAYLIDVPADALAVGGEVKYGLLKRGDAPGFLLMYYAKFAKGDVAAAPKLGLPLEVVAAGDKFQVLFQGKPAVGTEVVIATADKKDPIKTDDKGEFTFDAKKPGLYALRARHIEKTSGEHDGQKYQEARHYSTLSFRVAAAKEQPAALPALPRAVASFGADAAGDSLYVYGGHCSKTHSYSTESVCGTFHRLSLSNPTKWEELPGGPGLQGLALVSHGGKLYRLGGMQPRNPPGEKADNHSVATCARFDPATGKWESLPDLPAARSSHDAVVVDNKIVVVGGWKMNGRGKENDFQETALILDLTADKLAWKSVKQPFKRRALAAATFDGKVFVLGGIAEDNSTERTVDIYDVAKDTWAVGPKLHGPDRNGFGPSAYAAAGRLHVTLADGRVMRLNAKGDAWEEAAQLKQPRIVGRMVFAGGQLVILGGAMKGENISLTEVVRPTP